MKRKTPHNANSSSTEDTEGGRHGKAPLCKNLPKRSTRQEKSKWCTQAWMGGTKGLGTSSKTPPLVGIYAVSKQVPHCNMVRPQKMLPSRAPTQHMNRPPRDTKQNKALWERVHFNISAVKYLEIGRKILILSRRVGMS